MRAPLAVLGSAAAVALCWYVGLVQRSDRVMGGDGPFRDDWLQATGVGTGTAALLGLGLGALAVLRAPWWLLLGTLAATGHHLVLAVAADRHAATPPVDREWGFGTYSDGIWDVVAPGSWPLLALVLAAAVAVLRPAPPSRGPLSPAGRRSVGAAFLLASLTGLVGWWFNVYFQFWGAQPEPSDYTASVVTAAGVAALVALGVVVVRTRWGTWSAAGPAAVAVLVQAFVVAQCLPEAGGDVDVRLALESAVWLPTSWPLVAVLALAVATGAGRVESWTPSRAPVAVP